MTDVNQVETTVGKNDLHIRLSQFLNARGQLIAI